MGLLNSLMGAKALINDINSRKKEREGLSTRSSVKRYKKLGKSSKDTRKEAKRWEEWNKSWEI